MRIGNISTFSMTGQLRASVSRLNADLADAEVEQSSGMHADQGLALGALVSRSISLSAAQDHLQAFVAGNALASARLDATQAAITSLLGDATNFRNVFATSTTSSTVLADAAAGNLDKLATALNTRQDGQYIFGGLATDAAPIGDSNGPGFTALRRQVATAFQSTFGFAPGDARASGISATQMQGFLDGPVASIFAGSDFSNATSTPQTSAIAPGASVTTSVAAGEVAFRTLAKAWVIASDLNTQSLSHDAAATLAGAATQAAGEAVSNLTDLGARVGAMQKHITDANDSLTLQGQMLASSFDRMNAVDPYATAVRINALTTQIETAYALTSRLQQLSLVKYLT